MNKFLILFLSASFLLTSCFKKIENEYDIIIYGGTSAGVIAAYSSSLEGKKVLLIEPGKHLGGLTSGGLGQTDIGNKHAVTGLSRNFYRRIGDHYGKLEGWTFEPSVAERIMNDYIKEKGIEVLYNYRIIKAFRKGKRLKSILLENSENPVRSTRKHIGAAYFIDCSYEGDLMALSGVSYTLGRESNEDYGETYNGVQLREAHQFPDSIDPYRIPGDPGSGLCYGIQSTTLAPRGSGDKLIQAYNYRLCITQNPDNKIPFTRPENYDSTHFELLRRVIRQRAGLGWIQRIDQLYLIISPMPSGKTDVNNKGPFSTDAIGMNWEYPEASYEKRAEIAVNVREYIKGLLWFLSTDPAVTPELRSEMSSWGWAADEFTDNDHFPHQMYVREARRMVGEYVMTEHNCLGDSTVHDGIGLAAYTMDSHNCQRVVVNGMVKNEGDVQIGGFPPYQISYRSLTPKREECENLMVPVCLSSTHIAFGSIRMEPVFMVLGQVSALAISMAMEDNRSVQEIDYERLIQKLKTDPFQNGTPPDIVVDNTSTGQVEITGNWDTVTSWMGQYMSDHLIHLPSEGQAWVKYQPVFGGNPGNYKAYLYIPRRSSSGEPASRDYSNEVQVEISCGGKIQTRICDFNAHAYDWVELGSFQFSEGDFVKIVATGNKTKIPADALLLVAE